MYKNLFPNRLSVILLLFMGLLQKFRGVAVVFASGLIVAALFGPSASAMAGSIQLQVPTRDQDGTDSALNVVVEVTASSPVSIVQTAITYNPAQVQYIGASYDNSPLTTSTPEEAAAENTISISRFKAGEPYPTGTFQLAILEFQIIDASEDIAFALVADQTLVFEQSSASEIADQVSGVQYDPVANQSTALTTEAIDRERVVQPEPASLDEPSAQPGDTIASDSSGADIATDDVNDGSMERLLLIFAIIISLVGVTIALRLIERGREQTTNSKRIAGEAEHKQFHRKRTKAKSSK